MDDGLIRFACACGCRMKAASKLIGRSAKCPKCGASVIVSPAVTTRPDPPLARPPMPPPVPREDAKPAPKEPPRSGNKTLRILKKSLLRNVPAVICLVGMAVFLVVRGVSVYSGRVDNAASDPDVTISRRSTPMPALAIDSELEDDREVEFSDGQVRVPGRGGDDIYAAIKQLMQQTAVEFGETIESMPRPKMRRYFIPEGGTIWVLRGTMQATGREPVPYVWKLIHRIDSEIRIGYVSINGKLISNDPAFRSILLKLPAETKWETD